MVFSCAASFTGGIHGSLSGEYSSALGVCLFGHSGSSKMPALMICLPGNESPVRKRVVPQSGQKYEMIGLPVSPTLEICLGVPILVSAYLLDFGGGH
jgi:hypothetical protein